MKKTLCVQLELTKKPGSWALINKQGEVAAYAPNYYDGKPYGFYQIGPFNGREVTIARYFGVYVLINKKGEIVSDYYTSLYFSEKSNAFIGERRAPLIVIDANKNKLFEPKRSYSDIYYPNKKLNRIHAQFEQKSLFLDFEGNEIIAPCEYTIYMHSDDGLAEFEDTNGLYGYMDLDGNIVIEPQYTSAETFVHGLALVKKDDKLFYINEKNEKQFNMDFLSAETFSLSGIAKVKFLNKKEAFINIHGEILYEYDEDNLKKIYGGEISIGKFTKKKFAEFKSNIGCGLIDCYGKISIFDGAKDIELNPDYPLNVFLGYNGLYGYIDDYGNIAHTPKFTRASQANEIGDAMFSCEIEGKTYNTIYINLKNGAFKPLTNDYIFGNFDSINGLAKVKIDRTTRAYMDKNFMIDMTHLYIDASDFSDGYAIVCEKESLRILDASGKDITNKEYDYILNKNDMIEARKKKHIENIDISNN